MPRPNVDDVFMPDPSGRGGGWFVLAGALTVIGVVVALIVRFAN